MESDDNRWIENTWSNDEYRAYHYARADEETPTEESFNKLELMIGLGVVGVVGAVGVVGGIIAHKLSGYF